MASPLKIWLKVPGQIACITIVCFVFRELHGLISLEVQSFHHKFIKNSSYLDLRAKHMDEMAAKDVNKIKDASLQYYFLLNL